MRQRILCTLLPTVSAGVLLLACSVGGTEFESEIATLDHAVFNVKFSCVQTYTGQAPFCADDNAIKRVTFFHQGGGDFIVLDEPDSGYVLRGAFGTAPEFDPLTLDWHATSPDGYSETGRWEFAGDRSRFHGGTHYVADDGTYTGSCSYEGAVIALPLPPDTYNFGLCSGGGGGNQDIYATLDLAVFNEKFSCSQTYTGQGPFCADSNDTNRLKFFNQGGGDFIVLDEPDSGYVLQGTFGVPNALSFAWQATSPDGYSEAGTWTFAANLLTFQGDTNYAANNGSYTGNCLEEAAAVGLALPPDTGPIGACP